MWALSTNHVSFSGLRITMLMMSVLVALRFFQADDN
jgi:hypothetical protein